MRRGPRLPLVDMPSPWCTLSSLDNQARDTWHMPKQVRTASSHTLSTTWSWHELTPNWSGHPCAALWPQIQNPSYQTLSIGRNHTKNRAYSVDNWLFTDFPTSRTLQNWQSMRSSEVERPANNFSQALVIKGFQWSLDMKRTLNWLSNTTVWCLLVALQEAWSEGGSRKHGSHPKPQARIDEAQITICTTRISENRERERERDRTRTNHGSLNKHEH